MKNTNMNTIEATKIENKGDVEKMENKTIVLKGSNEVVSIVGFDEYEILGYQVVEALNENYLLDDLVNDGVVEVENLYNNSNEYYSIGGNEYLVVEGEESADRKAIDYVLEIFADCGIGNELITIADNHGFINADWFEEAQIESYEFYMDDIENEPAENEEYENRLEEEIAESDCENRDEYLEYLCSEDAMEWYKFNFGQEEFEKRLIENDLIDLKELAKYCVECDGRGHSLSSYDGEEINEDDLYIYRVN